MDQFEFSAVVKSLSKVIAGQEVIDISDYEFKAFAKIVSRIIADQEMRIELLQNNLKELQESYEIVEDDD